MRCVWVKRSGDDGISTLVAAGSDNPEHGRIVRYVFREALPPNFPDGQAELTQRMQERVQAALLQLDGDFESVRTDDE